MKILGITSTFVYVALGYFGAALSLHGPDPLLYVAPILAFIAIISLWWIYFTVQRHNLKHSVLIFVASALGIIILLTGAIIGSMVLLDALLY